MPRGLRAAEAVVHAGLLHRKPPRMAAGVVLLCIG